MATVPALTDRSDRQRWSGVRDEEGLWGDLRPELLEAVRTILERPDRRVGEPRREPIDTG